jgi:hypothetical protein
MDSAKQFSGSGSHVFGEKKIRIWIRIHNPVIDMDLRIRIRIKKVRIRNTAAESCYSPWYGNLFSAVVPDPNLYGIVRFLPLVVDEIMHTRVFVSLTILFKLFVRDLLNTVRTFLFGLKNYGTRASCSWAAKKEGGSGSASKFY